MTCECGCGEDALTGSFKPGHDQKLRISLEKRVGGLSNLRSLIESSEKFNSGSISMNALTATILKVFDQR